MFQVKSDDRKIFRHFITIALPIIIQNGITNFVSLLDNIMVGQVGTVPMSGVSIVNGLLFVFNLCVFGASAGAGIFTAQFHGSRDEDGIRHTFRFKFIICSAISLIGVLLFLFADRFLIGLYLTGEGDAATAAGAMEHGVQYLHVMLWGFLPFALNNAYASTLRETDEATVPMIGGIVAVLVNLVLNYVLIFGHFGAPALGVEGAAIATVVSRYVELAIVAGWTHFHHEKAAFIQGAYRSPYIPRKLLGSIVRKGMPLLVNEFFWSSGMAVLNQCYSTCGLDVVPAMNISNTLWNLSSVVFLAMGNAVGIVMGQMLGSGAGAQEVRSTNRKLMGISIFFGFLFGLLTAALSSFFPGIYNTTLQVRQLATAFLCILAAIMPFNTYTTATYFTLRSGGQTIVTFLFDSCFVWAILVPTAYCLSRFTGISIIPLFAICQGIDLIKCALATYMLRQGKWIQNLTV